jgi:nitrite reductase (NADH) small subunit
MPVVRFDPAQVNFLEFRGRCYFVHSTDDRTFFLVADACPHRGGPLHLGRLDVRAGVIRCPWHERNVPLASVRQRAIPLVWRRGEAVAILPGEEAGPVLLRHREILANEARTAEPGLCAGGPCP